ncbi:MAG: hypothetical protein SGJ16_12925 [Nitrospirota bacterium]|nr:hypothetical protein [Nitrospirota bacterium]
MVWLRADCLHHARTEVSRSHMRGRLYHARQEARTEIFAYLEGFYNRSRRHSTLGYLSPVESEQRAAQSTSAVYSTGKPGEDWLC